eukprot:jgi/Mesvir1/22425/Mv17901-RA.1
MQIVEHKCPVEGCDKSYSLRKSYVDHIRKRHGTIPITSTWPVGPRPRNPDDPIVEFRCQFPDCRRVYTLRKSWMEHARQRHNLHSKDLPPNYQGEVVVPGSARAAEHLAAMGAADATADQHMQGAPGMSIAPTAALSPHSCVIVVFLVAVVVMAVADTAAAVAAAAAADTGAGQAKAAGGGVPGMYGSVGQATSPSDASISVAEGAAPVHPSACSAEAPVLLGSAVQADDVASMDMHPPPGSVAPADAVSPFTPTDTLASEMPLEGTADAGEMESTAGAGAADNPDAGAEGAEFSAAEAVAADAAHAAAFRAKVAAAANIAVAAMVQYLASRATVASTVDELGAGMAGADDEVAVTAAADTDARQAEAAAGEMESTAGMGAADNPDAGAEGADFSVAALADRARALAFPDDVTAVVNSAKAAVAEFEAAHAAVAESDDEGAAVADPADAPQNAVLRPQAAPIQAQPQKPAKAASPEQDEIAQLRARPAYLEGKGQETGGVKAAPPVPTKAAVQPPPPVTKKTVMPPPPVTKKNVMPPAPSTKKNVMPQAVTQKKSAVAVQPPPPVSPPQAVPPARKQAVPPAAVRQPTPVVAVKLENPAPVADDVPQPMATPRLSTKKPSAARSARKPVAKRGAIVDLGLAHYLSTLLPKAKVQEKPAPDGLGASLQGAVVVVRYMYPRDKAHPASYVWEPGTIIGVKLENKFPFQGLGFRVRFIERDGRMNVLNLDFRNMQYGGDATKKVNAWVLLGNVPDAEMAQARATLQEKWAAEKKAAAEKADAEKADAQVDSDEEAEEKALPAKRARRATASAPAADAAPPRAASASTPPKEASGPAADDTPPPPPAPPIQEEKASPVAATADDTLPPPPDLTEAEVELAKLQAMVLKLQCKVDYEKKAKEAGCTMCKRKCGGGSRTVMQGGALGMPSWCRFLLLLPLVHVTKCRLRALFVARSRGSAGSEKRPNTAASAGFARAHDLCGKMTRGGFVGWEDLLAPAGGEGPGGMRGTPTAGGDGPGGGDGGGIGDGGGGGDGGDGSCSMDKRCAPEGSNRATRCSRGVTRQSWRRVIQKPGTTVSFGPPFAHARDGVPCFRKCWQKARRSQPVKRQKKDKEGVSANPPSGYTDVEWEVVVMPEGASPELPAEPAGSPHQASTRLSQGRVASANGGASSMDHPRALSGLSGRLSLKKRKGFPCKADVEPREAGLLRLHADDKGTTSVMLTSPGMQLPRTSVGPGCGSQRLPAQLPFTAGDPAAKKGFGASLEPPSTSLHGGACRHGTHQALSSRPSSRGCCGGHSCQPVQNMAEIFCAQQTLATGYGENLARPPTASIDGGDCRLVMKGYRVLRKARNHSGSQDVGASSYKRPTLARLSSVPSRRGLLLAGLSVLWGALCPGDDDAANAGDLSGREPTAPMAMLENTPSSTGAGLPPPKLEASLPATARPFVAQVQAEVGSTELLVAPGLGLPGIGGVVIGLLLGALLGGLATKESTKRQMVQEMRVMEGDAQEAIASVQKTVSALEQDKAEAAARNQSLAQQKAALEEDTARRMAALESDKEKLQKQLARERADAITASNAKDKQLGNLSANLAAERQAVGAIWARFATLDKALGIANEDEPVPTSAEAELAAEERVAAMVESVTMMQALISQLNLKGEELTKRVNGLMASEEGLQAEVARLKQEVTDGLDKLSTAGGAIDALSNEKAGLERTLEQSKLLGEQLRSDVEMLEAALEQSKGVAEALRRDIEVLEEANRDLLRKLADSNDALEKERVLVSARDATVKKLEEMMLDGKGAQALLTKKAQELEAKLLGEKRRRDAEARMLEALERENKWEKSARESIAVELRGLKEATEALRAETIELAEALADERQTSDTLREDLGLVKKSAIIARAEATTMQRELEQKIEQLVEELGVAQEQAADLKAETETLWQSLLDERAAVANAQWGRKRERGLAKEAMEANARQLREGEAALRATQRGLEAMAGEVTEVRQEMEVLQKALEVEMELRIALEKQMRTSEPELADDFRARIVAKQDELTQGLRVARELREMERAKERSREEDREVARADEATRDQERAREREAEMAENEKLVSEVQALTYALGVERQNASSLGQQAAMLRGEVDRLRARLKQADFSAEAAAEAQAADDADGFPGDDIGEYVEDEAMEGQSPLGSLDAGAAADGGDDDDAWVGDKSSLDLLRLLQAGGGVNSDSDSDTEEDDEPETTLEDLLAEARAQEGVEEGEGAGARMGRPAARSLPGSGGSRTRSCPGLRRRSQPAEPVCFMGGSGLRSAVGDV